MPEPLLVPNASPNAQTPGGPIPLFQNNPDTAAGALGHSNSLLQNMISGGESLLPAAGGIAGGIAGGALGAVAGGPVGAFAGAIGGSALGGAAGQIAESGLQGKVATPGQVGTQAALMGGTEAIGGPIAAGAGKLLEGAGKIASDLTIPTSAVDAGKIQSYKAANPLWDRIVSTVTGKGVAKPPATAAQTIWNEGFIGTEGGIGIRAKRMASNLWTKTVQPALKNSSATQDMGQFFDEAAASITKNTTELGDRSARLTALQAIRDEYAKDPTATMEQLQGYKEGWASHVPQKSYKGEDITGTYNNVRGELADLARQKLYDNLGPGVKQAYLDYGNLKALQQLGKEAMTGKKSFSGAVWNDIKDYVLTPAGTFGGQTIYKVGQGVELFGSAGAKTVADLASQSGTQNQTGE